MIHGICLIRNEAAKDRWLEQYYKQMHMICDRLIFLDDNSTDNTVDSIVSFHEKYTDLLSKTVDLEIIQNDTCLWEVNELLARKKLWNKAISQCKHGDWILNLDADEIFVEEHIDYLKHCLRFLGHYPPKQCDAFAFRLFDMWSDTHYRFDECWVAHLRQWIMAVRYNKNKEYKWRNKKLHCGRFPFNSGEKIRDSLVPIKHMSYSKQKFRQLKYDRYIQLDSVKQDGWLKQYKSILDENPKLIQF